METSLLPTTCYTQTLDEKGRRNLQLHFCTHYKQDRQAPPPLQRTAGSRTNKPGCSVLASRLRSPVSPRANHLIPMTQFSNLSNRVTKSQLPHRVVRARPPRLAGETAALWLRPRQVSAGGGAGLGRVGPESSPAKSRSPHAYCRPRTSPVPAMTSAR